MAKNLAYDLEKYEDSESREKIVKKKSNPTKKHVKEKRKKDLDWSDLEELDD